MNFIKNGLSLFSLICFSISNMEAQSNSLTTGGNASSSAGSVSYSIGQIDYILASGTTGNLNQGLQQPFEFFIITGTYQDGIHLNIRAFPNPTDYMIYLEMDFTDLSNLNYQIYNIQGQLLESNKIKSKNTLIDLKSFIHETYILTISRNQQQLKSFKIIKN